jgi:hypothetical protein
VADQRQYRRLADVGVRVAEGFGEGRDGHVGDRAGQRGGGAGPDLPGGVGLGGDGTDGQRRRAPVAASDSKAAARTTASGSSVS